MRYKLGSITVQDNLFFNNLFFNFYSASCAAQRNRMLSINYIITNTIKIYNKLLSAWKLKLL